MKKVLIALTLMIIMASCSSHHVDKNTGNATNIDNQNEDLLKENSVKDLVALNHEQLKNVKGDLKSFISFLAILNKSKLSSIAIAADYVKTCIGSGNQENDDIYVLFCAIYYSIANEISDSLEIKYKGVMDDFENNRNSSRLRIFKSNLAECGTEIFLSEGQFYLDVEADYFYDNFKGLVSKGLKEFLLIRSEERKKGFSEDAGLLISFEEVYQRAKRWEQFVNDYPKAVCIDEARMFYDTYLETLMTGMDNSRVFEGEDNILVPEIKALYEKIMKEDAQSKITKIITSYYSFLSKNNFKEIDGIDNFLKENNLSSMLAVQPFLR
ncbi:MAG: hypothetical protein WCH34_16095 [Bacteroidota bacterium]